MSAFAEEDVVKRWERFVSGSGAIKVQLEIGKRGGSAWVGMQSLDSEQASLRQQVVEEDTEEWQRSLNFSGLERVGGVDLSFIKGDDVNACAQLVVLSYPDLEVLYEDSQMVTLTAPYIAGFLAFRETPCLLDALQRLEKSQPALLPQVVLVDGNGLFHYREFGLACHLGVLSGLPCVGVAKNLLQVQGVAKDNEHQSQLLSRKEETASHSQLPQAKYSARPCVAQTAALSRCMYLSVTRSVWTQLCASHTPAAATGSPSPSDRLTFAPENTFAFTSQLQTHE
ncbi:endonuclease V isoform X2 [Myripristis murdjan]|uniref:endonuclease V isoform X2 n=1 Tax=Myripristis murdjan TaxID=586833 RepID=UPI001175F029|nr:endonuclease V isoform X2 [Myripristis murdjan]